MSTSNFEKSFPFLMFIDFIDILMMMNFSISYETKWKFYITLNFVAHLKKKKERKVQF